MLPLNAPIPSRKSLCINSFDDEYMGLFYFVNYGDNTEKYKTMNDLSDAQREYINKRLQQLEKVRTIKIDKKKRDYMIIQNHLQERLYKYSNLTITTENRRRVVTIINPVFTHGRTELEHDWLVSDIKDCIKRYCFYKTMLVKIILDK